MQKAKTFFIHVLIQTSGRMCGPVKVFLPEDPYQRTRVEVNPSTTNQAKHLSQVYPAFLDCCHVIKLTNKTRTVVWHVLVE